jgi:hypothetical protein
VQYRWNGLLSGQSGSLHDRFLEYLAEAKFRENWFDEAFGLGAPYAFIENQFGHLLIGWGVVGLVLFIGTFLQNWQMAPRENRVMIVYLNLVWAVAGVVLVTTYLFPLFVSFALLVSLAWSVSLSGGNEAYPRRDVLPEGGLPIIVDFNMASTRSPP